MTLAAEEPLDLLADYRRETRGYDEAVDDDGRPRPSHAGALRALEGHDLEALAATVDEQVAGEGVCFHSTSGDEAFVIDPVPRVLDAQEWEAIEAGLAQRVRALNRFIADVYAERRIVDAGIMPARVIDTAEYYEPEMQGVRPPGDVWIGVAGLDLVRDANGRFQVLEDNVRTPSGYSYAARRAARARRPARRAGRRRCRAGSTTCPRCCASRSRPPRPARIAARPRCSPTASATPPTTSTSGPPRRSGSRCSSPTTSPRATTSASSTGARTPTASTRPSAGCCGSRCARAASPSSTRSAPGSPTTSSRTPTSKT